MSDGVSAVLQAEFILGISVLLFTPFGHKLKSSFLMSEPVIATALGIVFGPYVAGWINPTLWAGSNLRAVEVEVARFVIAIQVVNVGTDMPTIFLRRHWPSIATALTIVIVLMWIVSSAFVLAVFPRVGILTAVLTGACITPTDPVLSSVLLRGRFAETFIPIKLRHMLAIESAANDGLVLPLVQLPVLLLLHPAGSAIGIWFYNAWAYNVLLSIVIGTAWGAAVAGAFTVGMKRKLWDKESQAATLVALALSIVGGVESMGSDGILAAFCGGLAFGTFQAPEVEDEIMEREHAINALEIILTFFFFIFFGALLPWGSWYDLGGGRLVVLAVAIAFLRRLPAILVAHEARLLPIFITRREALLAGWLGPIGVAAVFWSALASQRLGFPSAPNNAGEVAYTISTFMVFVHVILYSVTGPLAGRGYAMYEAMYVLPGPGESIRTVPTHTEHELEFGVWPPSTLGRGMENLRRPVARPRLPSQLLVPPPVSAGTSRVAGSELSEAGSAPSLSPEAVTAAAAAAAAAPTEVVVEGGFEAPPPAPVASEVEVGPLADDSEVAVGSGDDDLEVVPLEEGGPDREDQTVVRDPGEIT